MPEISDQHRIPIDPAPSRWSYKFLRLMLSPILRRLLFFGAPICLLIFVIGMNLADEDRYDRLRTTFDEIYLSIVERPEFMVNLMSINGASDAVMQDIREVIPIDFPVSSFTLDLDHMKKVITELGPVKEVDLRIHGGGILEIKIIERNPAILWRRDAGLEVLDQTGTYVTSITSRLDYPTLPLIAGEDADSRIKEANLLFKAAEPLKDRVRGFVLIGKRRWNIVLDREQTLMLPEQNPVASLEQIIVLNDAYELLDRDVRAVDFRIENRPTLHLTLGAVKELNDIKLIQGE